VNVDPRENRIGRIATREGLRVARSAAHRFGALTSWARVSPDLLIVGAMRGGTTTLYHYLVRHPAVVGAVFDKEVHYFDLHHADGPGWYRARFPTRWSVDRLGRRVGGSVQVAEATPYYLFHPLVPARVAAELPHVRAIALLRDPAERAWSHYRHEVDLGYESLPFDEAMDREPERLAGLEERMRRDPSFTTAAHQHHSYLARGRYAEQLERWFDVMPRQRVLVLRSEDLYAQPAATFARVLAFLELPAWSPGRFRTLNAATSTDMPPATRARLRAYFRPHDERLADLLGTDVWWPA